MRAETAAAYTDEVSTSAFRRKVGKIYPKPIHVSGRGQVWLKDQLDRTITELGQTADESDAAELL
jgi:hypothetical protein